MTTLKKGHRGASVVTLQIALNRHGYGLIADGIFGTLTEEALKDFQRRNGLTADGIAGPKSWQALDVPVGSGNKRNIKEIIVHCSATPEGKDFTTADIKKWHLARGFADIGYHWVIYRDGTVHKGRDESLTGAHCTNHNTISIGICYVGGYASDGKTPKDTRTEAQKAALVKLLKELKARYPQASIHSHRDFAAKACPSFDATKEFIQLR